MSNNSKNCAVILAGGQGKRMKSDLPIPMFDGYFKCILF